MNSTVPAENADTVIRKREWALKGLVLVILLFLSYGWAMNGEHLLEVFLVQSLLYLISLGVHLTTAGAKEQKSELPGLLKAALNPLFAFVGIVILLAAFLVTVYADPSWW